MNIYLFPPPWLKSDFMEEIWFINVKSFDVNTTLLIQPMDSKVISKYKMLYTKALFEVFFEVIDGTYLALQ